MRASRAGENNGYITWEDAAAWVANVERGHETLVIIHSHPHRDGTGKVRWTYRMSAINRLTDEWKAPRAVVTAEFPTSGHKTVPALLIYMADQLDRILTEKMMDAQRQARF